jgi:serine O-acetyltransferase
MSSFDKFCERILEINNNFCNEVPSMVRTHYFMDELINFLFPIKIDKQLDLYDMKNKLHELRYLFRKLISPLAPHIEKDVEEVTTLFFTELPEIYQGLLKDAEVYHKSDPASFCVEEIILSYPGYYAISIYRFANFLYRLKIPILPRVMSEYAHNKTGIDIHPGAEIGEHFYIDHGTGIVIGESATIGNNVKMYQGVTLGALYVEKGLSNQKRHPTIQDNVIIYAGGTILGGETVIGHDTTIGGNVWITESVPPFSVVYRRPKIIIRDSKEFTQPINFII